MIEQAFVATAFGAAGIFCLVSLYVSFIWLPRKMERAYRNALRTLATAVETKDSSTLGHAERVAELAVRIAEKLGLPPAEVKNVRYAALMRDIGKASVPHRILNKQGELTEGELRVVRNHVKEGASIVSQIPFLAPIADVILHHHERWDGSGYPDGLAGDQIPLASRIIGLVDDYEAMTSERPYHRAVSEAEARRFIEEGAGVLYDPVVVEAFLSVAASMPLGSDSPEANAA
ncbi:MAG: hypothetical protein KatS3mg024_0049 [Armatimonadota bacterium]|nr:MAG: hypothetical protein KatS3mg024_0049 [Armatimonadota bacterium]